MQRLNRCFHFYDIPTTTYPLREETDQGRSESATGITREGAVALKTEVHCTACLSMAMVKVECREFIN